MTLTIELTPEEEARLLEAARQEGLDATEYARRRLSGVTTDIGFNERGQPIVEGTRIKVRIIAEDLLDGRTAADIAASYPHVSLAQIHAAISYYYHHKALFDEEIQRGRLLEEETRAQTVQPTHEEMEERARQLGYVRTPEGLRKTA